MDLPSFSIVRRRADCASLVTERFGHYAFLTDFLFQKLICQRNIPKLTSRCELHFVSVCPEIISQVPSRKLTSNTPSSRFLRAEKLRMTVLSVVKLFNSTTLDLQFHSLKSASNLAVRERGLAFDDFFGINK